MSTAAESKEAEAAIDGRLRALGWRRDEVTESFVRSGGHGGQNVNKTSTCVLLVHRPTGLQVKCQTTRHQGRNRGLAWQRLIEKLEERERRKHTLARAQAEKVRRQRRPRSRGAKERMLANKAHQARKKSDRRPVGMD